ncbi:MAG: aspartate 1-decarboxylase [bacterium]
MKITLMKSKIHRATVTEANLNYMGSITIDRDLMDAAGMLTHEKVQVLDFNNGARLETYIIAGERGSGVICLNGPSAHLITPGDNVVIIAYAELSQQEAEGWQPTVVFVDENNKAASIVRGEKPGTVG